MLPHIRSLQARPIPGRRLPTGVGPGILVAEPGALAGTPANTLTGALLAERLPRAALRTRSLLAANALQTRSLPTNARQACLPTSSRLTSGLPANARQSLPTGVQLTEVRGLQLRTIAHRRLPTKVLLSEIRSRQRRTRPSLRTLTEHSCRRQEAGGFPRRRHRHPSRRLRRRPHDDLGSPSLPTITGRPRRPGESGRVQRTVLLAVERWLPHQRIQVIARRHPRPRGHRPGAHRP
ncbi:hypothetical protein OHA21_23180 [Actinoplanes sp. NBC_00393]|uniref:hypothetical protein n=1 Tax=Actinoplanes sp. NBC_00393 TaxID=2975953 RepID=UPI002E1B8E03